MKTKDEIQIRELYETFVNAWQSRNTDGLENILSEDCDIDFSIFDKGIQINEFKKQLAYRGLEPTYTRFEIFNYVCATDGEKAAQSGVIQGIFVKEDTDTPTTFNFNGFMMNTLKKVNGEWKFDALRFNLGSESDNHARLKTTGVSVDYYTEGDTRFVDNWHFIEMSVGWHKDSRLLSVVPEIDAPWYYIQNRTNLGSDEDQIEEKLYEYCIALDWDCLELYGEVFSDNLQAEYEGFRIFNKRTATQMLRFERQGMIGMGHIIFVDTIDIHGDEANVTAYRSGYLPADKLFGSNKFNNHYCAHYYFKLKKEEKGWRITKLQYLPGRITKPMTERIYYSETK